MRYNVPSFTAFVPTGTAIVTLAIDGSFAGAGSVHTITVDTTSTINAGGAISIGYPSSFKILAAQVRGGFGVGTTSSKSVYNGLNSIVLTTPTAYSKVSNGIITIDVYVQNPTLAGTSGKPTVIGHSAYAIDAPLFSA